MQILSSERTRVFVALELFICDATWVRLYICGEREREREREREIERERE